MWYVCRIHNTYISKQCLKKKIIKYSRTALCRQDQRFYLSNETSKD